MKALFVTFAALAATLPTGVGGQSISANTRTPPSAAAHAPARLAQDATNATLTFAVVSVRPHQTDSPPRPFFITPDGIWVSGLPLIEVLRNAFGVWTDRIVRAPGWVNSSRFDIQAKVATEDAAAFRNLKVAQMAAMLLPALQDRFGLKFHHETLNLKAYALVIAKGQSKLKESDPNNTSSLDVDDPDVPSTTGGIMRMMPNEFIGRRVRIAQLTYALSLVVDKTVVDQAGLTPEFDPVAPGTWFIHLHGLTRTAWTKASHKEGTG